MVLYLKRSSVRGSVYALFTLRNSACFELACANTHQHGMISESESGVYWFFSRRVEMHRDIWGHSYLTIRGEILGLVKDDRMRKHLPKVLSLIKNES